MVRFEWGKILEIFWGSVWCFSNFVNFTFAKFTFGQVRIREKFRNFLGLRFFANFENFMFLYTSVTFWEVTASALEKNFGIFCVYECFMNFINFTFYELNKFDKFYVLRIIEILGIWSIIYTLYERYVLKIMCKLNTLDEFYEMFYELYVLRIIRTYLPVNNVLGILLHTNHPKKMELALNQGLISFITIYIYAIFM